MITLTSSVRRSATLVLVLLGLLVAAVGRPVAYADTQPPAPNTPATVSTDPLPTVQVDGVVWTQVVIGNTVYAGGSFATARPAGAARGVNTVPRSNFLAYDINTGALLPFAPAFNAQIRTMATSPDQKTLYVGGQFTQVDGVNRYRLIAFDVATGAAINTFTATTDASVYGLAATETRLYAVGIFSKIKTASRSGAGAVDARTGAVLPFAVTPAGGSIRHVVVSPDRTKVVLAGNFTSMNGSSNPGYGLSRHDAGTGASLALPVNSLIRNATGDASITSLAAGTDGFYGTGYAFGRTYGNLEGAFKADWNGNRVWVEDCHGDTYSGAVDGTVVYVASHAHDCARIGGFPDTTNPRVYSHGLAFTSAATRTLQPENGSYYDFGGQPAPTLLHWFPDFTVGTYTGQSQGPWHVAVGANYVVYGGEFLRVNNKPQEGLVRFARAAGAPNDDGPRLSAEGMGLTGSASVGSIRLQWPANHDRDNTRLTYRLYRDNVQIFQTTADSTFWSRPNLSYTDRSVVLDRTYAYKVTAADPYGNLQTSSTISIRAR